MLCPKCFLSGFRLSVLAATVWAAHPYMTLFSRSFCVRVVSLIIPTCGFPQPQDFHSTCKCSSFHFFLNKWSWFFVFFLNQSSSLAGSYLPFWSDVTHFSFWFPSLLDSWCSQGSKELRGPVSASWGCHSQVSQTGNFSHRHLLPLRSGGWTSAGLDVLSLFMAVS